MCNLLGSTLCLQQRQKPRYKQSFRRKNRETQKKGEEVLQNWLKAHDLRVTTSIIEKLCTFHKIETPEAFFISLGERSTILGDKDLEVLNNKGGVSIQAALRKFVPFLSGDKKKGKEQEKFIVGKDFNKKIPIVINEENINTFVFPTCCHPIPGDDALGYIDNKGRIEVHKRSCSVAARLKSSSVTKY